jgi:hypothetical protein
MLFSEWWPALILDKNIVIETPVAPQRWGGGLDHGQQA